MSWLIFLVVPPQNSSKSRLRNLDQLHAFVVAATKELMWLNEKEEEEVNYDWSDRNSNMTAKKDNYSVRPPTLLNMIPPALNLPVESCSCFNCRESSEIISLHLTMTVDPAVLSCRV